MPSPVARSAAVAVAVAVGAITVTGCGGDDGRAEGRGAETTEQSTQPTTPSESGESSGTSGTSDQPSTDQPSTNGVPVYEVDLVATHPHDQTAFTQGLELVGDLLLESTGLEGESSIRLVEPATGRVIRSAAIGDDLFGEGATVVGDEIWQLTWKNEQVLVHGLDDLIERRRLTYRGEGWGLCATAEHLIMSDGSSRLTLRHRDTFEIIGSVDVSDDAGPVDQLNELECVDGLVWANVYQTTRLVAIDPTDGRVVGSADLSHLVPAGFEGETTDVANGIAHDPSTGRFYLGGKRWPVLYEVELVASP